MSQEAVPEQTASDTPVQHSVPGQQAAPKGLLQQMEELMAALTADLSQLDADLQTTGDRPPTTGITGTGTTGTTGTTSTSTSTSTSTHEGHRESEGADHREGRGDGRQNGGRFC